MREKGQDSPRILLGPQEISGFYGNLELGFSQIGVSARLVTTHPHPFGYPQLQTNPLWARLASRAVLRYRRGHRLLKPFWAMLYLGCSVLLVLWAVFRFDVFIFAWGTSFLPLNIDIPLYRLFNKKVFVVLGHGSEARPPYMSAPPHAEYPSDASELKKLRAEVKRIAATVRRNEKFASKIIGMQMNAQFLLRDFVDFYRLGLPTTSVGHEHALQPNPGHLSGKRFVILHVPSNRAAKGSNEIQSVMEKIAENFPDVEYRELSGVSHSEVLMEMENADLIVDQLWSDIPMAVVGAEAAALGKPTVVSSYGWPQWNEWQERHGSEFMPPVIRTTPSTLMAVIEGAVSRRYETAQIGLQAREFIEKVWSPTAVATNYLRVIEEKYPETWVIKPENVNYLWGAGVSQVNVLEMVSSLLESEGSAVLDWDLGASLYLSNLDGK